MVAMALCLIPSHAVCRHHSSMSIKYWLTGSAPIVISVFKLSTLFSHTGGGVGNVYFTAQDDSSERQMQ